MSIFYLRSNSVSPDPRVEKEVNSLLKNGYKVNILAWDRENNNKEREYLKLENGESLIYRFKGKAEYGGGLRTLFKLAFFQFFLLWNLLKNRKSIKIIHAADFDTVLPAVFMRVLFNKKVIYDVYDFYVEAFSVPKILIGIIKKLDLWVMGYVDVVIVTNEARKEQIKGANPRKLIVLHNTPGVDIDTVNINQYADKDYKITLAYVGILQNNRLLEEILNVVSGVPSVRLLIAGFGKLEGVVEKFSDDFENINFFGKVDYKEGLSISSSADYLFATYNPITPNHKYSSPNKLYESMMLGKPIIVCEDTGIDVIVEKENLGFVIKYTSASFEDILKHLSVDSNYIVIRNNLIESYKSKYSWGIMEERLLDVYNNL